LRENPDIPLIGGSSTANPFSWWNDESFETATSAFGCGSILPHALVRISGVNSNVAKQRSFAVGLGWSRDHLRLNLDHLWYRPDIIVIGHTPLDFYLGVGGRFYQLLRMPKRR